MTSRLGTGKSLTFFKVEGCGQNWVEGDEGGRRGGGDRGGERRGGGGGGGVKVAEVGEVGRRGGGVGRRGAESVGGG